MEEELYSQRLKLFRFREDWEEYLGDLKLLEHKDRVTTHPPHSSNIQSTSPPGNRKGALAVPGGRPAPLRQLLRRGLRPFL